MRLYPAFADCNVVFVSTLQQDLPGGEPLHLVADANRKNLLPFFGQILKLIKILFLERPDCIVTTGAAPGLIAPVPGSPHRHSRRLDRQLRQRGKTVPVRTPRRPFCQAPPDAMVPFGRR